MTAKERTMWEQAIRVLRRNTVIHTVDVETRKAERVLVRARERAASQRRILAWGRLSLSLNRRGEELRLALTLRSCPVA
jgi:hypothetical protein